MIPNIALFAKGRTWRYDFNAYAYRSNDGWIISEQDLVDAGPPEGDRVRDMLLDHIKQQCYPVEAS